MFVCGTASVAPYGDLRVDWFIHTIAWFNHTT
jgi:hypothetical protein